MIIDIGGFGRISKYTYLSSVPSESHFSAAGLIYNNHRARLSPESVRYLTFLHQNYKLGNL